MKKITLFLIVFSVSFSFAQSNLEDFETTYNVGAGEPLNFFEGLGGASQVADPLDATNQVLELISTDAGQPWQGAELLMQTNNIDLTTDITVQVDVYSTSTFDLFCKVENGVTGPNSATATAYTTAGAWQTLTFTFNQSLDGTSPASGEYGKFVFFPNWNISANGWNNPASNFSIYVDNVTAMPGAVLSTNDLEVNNFRVSPNPTNNTWNIEGSNAVINSVEVYDLLGKRVLNLYPNSQDVQIDASQLNTGIYLAKLSSKGATKTIKLVKN